jgi:hypothetical protein
VILLQQLAVSTRHYTQITLTSLHRNHTHVTTHKSHSRHYTEITHTSLHTNHTHCYTFTHAAHKTSAMICIGLPSSRLQRGKHITDGNSKVTALRPFETSGATPTTTDVRSHPGVKRHRSLYRRHCFNVLGVTCRMTVSTQLCTPCLAVSAISPSLFKQH